MSDKIQILRSTASGQAPTSLLPGELALNRADGRLFYLNADNQIVSLSTGGTSSTVVVATAGVSAVAGVTGAISIVAGANISIASDSAARSITISANASGSSGSGGGIAMSYLFS